MEWLRWYLHHQKWCKILQSDSASYLSFEHFPWFFSLTLHLIPLWHGNHTKYYDIKYQSENLISDYVLFIHAVDIFPPKTYLQDPCYYRCWNASMGNHTRLLFPGFFLPRPNHLGSHTAPVPQTRTPNSDHSTEHRPRPWSLLSMGRPEGSAHLLP